MSSDEAAIRASERRKVVEAITSMLRSMASDMEAENRGRILNEISARTGRHFRDAADAIEMCAPHDWRRFAPAPEPDGAQ